MPHSLIIGMTGSGKSTLAKMICQSAKGKVKTCVLDPVHDPDWQADFQTSDSEEFLSYVRRERSHLCFIDEGGQSIGRYNRPMEWTATTSRHLGHSVYYILQGASQVMPIIRSNCERAYLFACDPTIIDVVSREFAEPVIRDRPRLEKFEFYCLSKFEEVKLGRIDLEKREVNIVPLSTQKFPAESKAENGIKDGDLLVGTDVAS